MALERKALIRQVDGDQVTLVYVGDLKHDLKVAQDQQGGHTVAQKSKAKRS